MPPFETDKFVGDVIADLGRLRIDVATFKALDSEKRKEVLKRLLDRMINIPNVPDFLEPLVFSFAVEFIENFIKTSLDKNKLNPT